MTIPSQLYNPRNDHFVDQQDKLTPQAWAYLTSLQGGLSTVDLAEQVTGILQSANGGTGSSALTFPTAGQVVTTTAPVTAVELTVSHGVTPDSGGIKHKRLTTGAIGASSSAVVAVAWTSPFVDGNYTVAASVLDGTASSAALSVVHIEIQTASQVQIRVQNTSAGTLTGVLHVIALHD